MMMARTVQASGLASWASSSRSVQGVAFAHVTARPSKLKQALRQHPDVVSGYRRSVPSNRHAPLASAAKDAAAGSTSKDSSKGGKRKVLAVLYKAGEVAQREPRLLGCVENALGLRDFLSERGDVEFVVTADKEGVDSEFEKHLVDAEIIITTPFHPGYLTRDRIQKAKNLKLAITAGVGSDHVDIKAAAEAGITIVEVTGSNVVSVAEHVIMMILTLVRNYIPAYKQVVEGGWDVAEIAQHSFDLENKVVGSMGAGRIGQRVLQRLQPFNCAELLYTDYARLPKEMEEKLKLRYVENLEDMVKACDVVTINAPLHENTRGIFNKDLIGKMKPGAFLVNTSRGAICDTDAVAEACESGQLGGYAGDVWPKQPAPADHPWRRMKNHAMTPHYSGTTLDAQARYAAGTKEILSRYFSGTPQQPEDIILLGGKLAAAYDKDAKERNLNHKEGWEKLQPKAEKSKDLAQKK